MTAGAWIAVVLMAGFVIALLFIYAALRDFEESQQHQRAQDNWTRNSTALANATNGRMED